MLRKLYDWVMGLAASRHAPASLFAVSFAESSFFPIPPDVLPHIFERFRQGEQGPTREYGGLGLGLAIVRHLTEAHGGTVRADSDGTGHGSTFTVSLPLAMPRN